MDYIQATEAVRLLQPKKVLPIHFDFCKDPNNELDKFVQHCVNVNPTVEVIRTKKDKYYFI